MLQISGKFIDTIDERVGAGEFHLYLVLSEIVELIRFVARPSHIVKHSEGSVEDDSPERCFTE
jgi:hypothetical protein